MAVTLKEISRHFDVAPSTISRALNDDSRISMKMRKKINSYARKVGYHRNAVARSLKTSRTRTIGFIAPEIANEFFMKVAQGVEEKLEAEGYHLIICNSNEQVDEEKRRINLLFENRVDGMIIIPSSADGTHYSVLESSSIPFVLIDRLAEGIEADAVLVDNEGGTYEAISHLIDTGLKRIGFIGGDMTFTSAKERYAGYVRALRDHGIEPDETCIRFGDFHIESGYTCMRSMMEQPDAPEHVFIANVFMQIGAVKYIIEQGGSRPSSIGIAGFDEMYLSPALGFTSMTVAQPVLDIGREAAALLLKRIQGEEEPFPRILRLTTKLLLHD
jgi:LacI family transcriptional regulator